MEKTFMQELKIVFLRFLNKIVGCKHEWETIKVMELVDTSTSEWRRGYRDTVMFHRVYLKCKNCGKYKFQDLK